MERIPKAVYTLEFRTQAVALGLRDGLKSAEAASRLAISKKTQENWVGRAKADKLTDIGSNRSPVSEQEAEISRLRTERAEMKMARDLLKKAAAYFARESVPGTRS